MIRIDYHLKSSSEFLFPNLLQQVFEVEVIPAVSVIVPKVAEHLYIFIVNSQKENEALTFFRSCLSDRAVFFNGRRLRNSCDANRHLIAEELNSFKRTCLDSEQERIPPVQLVPFPLQKIKSFL